LNNHAEFSSGLPAIKLHDEINTGLEVDKFCPECFFFSNMFNKQCSNILQETVLNSVFNDLLPSMVGQSHYSFTLLSQCQECDVILEMLAGHSSVVHGV
jgi:hypothetical protein